MIMVFSRIWEWNLHNMTLLLMGIWIITSKWSKRRDGADKIFILLHISKISYGMVSLGIKDCISSKKGRSKDRPSYILHERHEGYLFGAPYVP